MGAGVTLPGGVSVKLSWQWVLNSDSDAVQAEKAWQCPKKQFQAD